ncbi:MAG: NAD(P)H-hydrate dehydratase [Betaproteobacteria bacterium]|nr:NAD(P)H-hydrate dehydratase [Betaproteobacteria bacterium]
MPSLLYSSQQLRHIEQVRAREKPSNSLMELAGARAAEFALAILKSRKARSRRVLVAAGPGNNGGDAWVAAVALSAAKCQVAVLSPGSGDSTDPAAKRARATFRKAGGTQFGDWTQAKTYAAECDMVIDGLFGIGLARAPSGHFAETMRGINGLHHDRGIPVLALDVPSGLDADTGGAFEPTIAASHTITFLGDKPGLHTGAGLELAGEVSIESLGLSLPMAPMQLLSADLLQELIPARNINAHKGTFGRVGIIGGAEGMVGAAILAARAALHMGPGKVSLGLLGGDKVPFDPLHPEIMMQDPKLLAKDENVSAFAIGMGMGDGGIVATALHAVLNSGKPAVIDADALALFTSNPSIAACFPEAKPAPNRDPVNLVLTPHPGEAARLLQCEVAAVQGDRIGAAQKIASRWQAIAVLKGAGTVIANPAGEIAINTSGNPGMASGGMGDALAGMIAAFLAQGLPPFQAAALSVYLHGAAADAAIDHGMAPRGLTASEVIFEARALLNSGLEHAEH